MRFKLNLTFLDFFMFLKRSNFPPLWHSICLRLLSDMTLPFSLTGEEENE